MSEVFHCPDHGTPFTAKSDGCGWCVIELRGGPRAEHMDRNARADEILWWVKRPLTVRFHHLWKRLDELVGRETYSHEWAEADRIAEEVRTGGRPEHPLSSLQRLAGDKPVIAVVVDR